MDSVSLVSPRRKRGSMAGLNEFATHHATPPALWMPASAGMTGGIPEHHSFKRFPCLAKAVQKALRTETSRSDQRRPRASTKSKA